MHQSIGMPQLMDCLLERSFLKKVVVLGKTIELLPQTL